jgi:hypothetical protein
MQPQSKSANRARVATIAIPDQRTVGTRSTIARIRTIRIWLQYANGRAAGALGANFGE